MTGRMAARPEGTIRPEERRRYPRVEVTLHIELETDRGSKRTGTILNLSPYGTKVKVGGKEPPPIEGSILRLRFEPRDGEPPLLLRGIVWRFDPDGQVVVFLNLRPHEFLRLKTLVNRLPRKRA